jgi:hypothetical protein
MRILLVAALVCALVGGVTLAQEQNEKLDLVKHFTRSAKLNGINLSFVLLNDRTVDVLFAAPGKYAIRARANTATTFYVQGTPESDMQLDTHFSVEQEGATLQATSLNIKNFTAGTATKGARIDGLLQLDKKLDLNQSFKIKGASGELDFKLTPEALKLLPPPPAQPPQPN